MARFLVRLTEVFFAEGDSLEEVYARYEYDADYCEVEEVESDD